MTSQNMVAQSATPKVYSTDVNNDGITDIADLAALLKVIQGKHNIPVSISTGEGVNIVESLSSNKLYYGGEPVTVKLEAGIGYELAEPVVSVTKNGVATTVEKKSNTWDFKNGEVILYHPLVDLGSSITIKSSATDKIYVVADSDAEFPGGTEALATFLSDNLKYPEDAQYNGIAGRVFVQFIINRDGSISDIEIMRNVHPSLDAEAIRLVESMPKWTPAKVKGVAVRSYFYLPIAFKLY